MRTERGTLPPRRCTQAGASLILVLALVAFLGALVPAVLALAWGGTQATRVVSEDRRATYAATSGIEAAMALLLQDDEFGDPRGPCPPHVVPIDGLKVTVECFPHPEPPDGCNLPDRFVSYLATVTEPGEVEVLARMGVEVVHRDGAAELEVRQWNPDAAGPPSTTTSLPLSCGGGGGGGGGDDGGDGGGDDPVAALLSGWDPASVETPTKGGEWWAEARLVVTDQLGVAAEGASVSVDVDYCDPSVLVDPENPDARWKDGETIVGTTGDTGSITFHSAPYSVTGTPKIEHLRFTVVAVGLDDGPEWNLNDSQPLQLEVRRKNQPGCPAI